jgi:hypothetical protein
MLFLQTEMQVLKTCHKREKMPKTQSTTEVQTKANEKCNILTAGLLKLQVSWDVTLCCWVNISPSFSGLSHLHLQHQAIQVLTTPFFLNCLIVKM